MRRLIITESSGLDGHLTEEIVTLKALEYQPNGDGDA